MNDEIIDLTPLEQKINALIFKAGYFIQTYRALDALNVLAEAHRKMDGQEVHWRVRTAVLKNTGQAEDAGYTPLFFTITIMATSIV